jgi:hypothetical protein
VPHSDRNASDEPARIVNIQQPAQRFESVPGHGPAHPQGKIKRLPPTDHRSSIYAAMLFGSDPDEIRPTEPSNHVVHALALIGRALCFKI